MVTVSLEQWANSPSGSVKVPIRGKCDGALQLLHHGEGSTVRKRQASLGATKSPEQFESFPLSFPIDLHE
jgi:hypothetical protein